MKHFFNNLRILVTGGCGFIGSHLAEILVQCGAQVTIIDNLSTGSLDNIANIRNHIRFLEYDVTNFNACMDAVENQHIVFHTAAFTSVPESFVDPLSCNNINAQGTLNLLEASYRYNVKRFIFSSSAAVYGSSQYICTEETSCKPESPYGFSKLTAELYIQQYAQLFGLNTVILRYFNVYGPRQKSTGAYAAAHARFYYAMQHGLPIIIYGDGGQTRDFIEVQKVVEANLLIASCKAENTRGHIFNIASGNSISLLEVITHLKQQFPYYTHSIQFAPARPGDIRHSCADISKYRWIIQQTNQQEIV